MASFRVRRARLRACLLLAALALPLLAACSDGDDSGGGATPTQPAPEVTPEAPAIIDRQVFISVASGYAIEYPEGWAPDDNFLFTTQTVTDVFFAPAEGEGAQGNIQIRCDRDDGELTAQEFIDARVQVARGFARGEVQQDEVTVGGEPAVRLQYQQVPSETITVNKTDVIFFSHGCGWTVTLTQPTDEDFTEEFLAVLGTFRFAN